MKIYPALHAKCKINYLYFAFKEKDEKAWFILQNKLNSLLISSRCKYLNMTHFGLIPSKSSHQTRQSSPNNHQNPTECALKKNSFPVIRNDSNAVNPCPMCVWFADRWPGHSLRAGKTHKFQQNTTPDFRWRAPVNDLARPGKLALSNWLWIVGRPCPDVAHGTGWVQHLIPCQASTSRVNSRDLRWLMGDLLLLRLNI